MIDTRHYHYPTDKSHYNRATYYHEHEGSFVLDDDGNYTHNHAEEPAVYLNLGGPERPSLPPTNAPVEMDDDTLAHKTQSKDTHACP